MNWKRFQKRFRNKKGVYVLIRYTQKEKGGN